MISALHHMICNRWTWIGSRSASNLRRAFAATLIAVGFAAPAMAAELQVYPIRIQMNPALPTEVVTIKNVGDTDALMQLSLVAWRQVNNDDELVPTRDILANPSVFLVKGNDQQIARIALRIPQSTKELSYRLVLQEVPRQRTTTGVSTVLRILVPIFVPASQPTTTLDWEARPVRGGMEITARNSGTAHAQIKSVKAIRAGGLQDTKLYNMYVLAGATRTIFLPTAKPVLPGAAVQLQADTDQGAFSANVRVGSIAGAGGSD